MSDSVPHIEMHTESSSEAQELEPADFYMDGPCLVFTERYHLKRGYCCNSDCRHCPYR